MEEGGHRDDYDPVGLRIDHKRHRWERAPEVAIVAVGDIQRAADYHPDQAVVRRCGHYTPRCDRLPVQAGSLEDAILGLG